MSKHTYLYNYMYTRVTFLNQSEAEVLWYSLDSTIYVLCVVWQVCSVRAHESKHMSLWGPMQRPEDSGIFSTLSPCFSRKLVSLNLKSTD